MSGRLFPPPNRLPAETTLIDSVTYRSGWTGTPLAAVNRGAELSAGILLGNIGDALNRDATLFVDQSDVPLVRMGQQVTVLASDRPSGSVQGTVTEVAASPVTDIPQELYAAGLLMPLPASAMPASPGIASSGISLPTPTLYQVRVKLSESANGLPIRGTAQGRIEVPSASIFHRLWHRHYDSSSPSP